MSSSKFDLKYFYIQDNNKEEDQGNRVVEGKGGGKGGREIINQCEFVRILSRVWTMV